MNHLSQIYANINTELNVSCLISFSTCKNMWM